MFSLLEQYFSPSNQIEEEFTAYLHTYTEMLHKVDGIGDTIEVNYLFIHSPIKKNSFKWRNEKVSCIYNVGAVADVEFQLGN